MKRKGIINRRSCEGCSYCSHPLLLKKGQICCELYRVWQFDIMPRWCKGRVEKGQK